MTVAEITSWRTSGCTKPATGMCAAERPCIQAVVSTDAEMTTSSQAIQPRGRDQVHEDRV